MSDSKHVYEAELRVRCRITAHSFEEAMGTALQQHPGQVEFDRVERLDNDESGERE